MLTFQNYIQESHYCYEYCDGDFYHNYASQRVACGWDFCKYTHWGWSLRFAIIIVIKPFNIYVRVFLTQPTSPLAHLDGEHKQRYH